MVLIWWEYLLIVLSIFVGCVFLNYFVKIFNETRLEQKFTRLQQKTSKNRSTQMQESSPIDPMSLRNAQSTNSTKEISFVYNKEENLKSQKLNSKSSKDSSKENSKLKFLGTIYNNENKPTNSNENTTMNGYDSNSLRRQSSKELLPVHSDKELKSWVSDLLLSLVNYK